MSVLYFAWAPTLSDPRCGGVAASPRSGSPGTPRTTRCPTPRWRMPWARPPRWVATRMMDTKSRAPNPKNPIPRIGPRRPRLNPAGSYTAPRTPAAWRTTPGLSPARTWRGVSPPSRSRRRPSSTASPRTRRARTRNRAPSSTRGCPPRAPPINPWRLTCADPSPSARSPCLRSRAMPRRSRASTARRSSAPPRFPRRR